MRKKMTFHYTGFPGTPYAPMDYTPAPPSITEYSAFTIAKKDGPSDELRRIASQNHICALLFAKQIDKGPHEVTREGACREAETAYEYARDIDKCPREDTRKASCRKATFAFLYARYIDKKPRDDTRNAACMPAENVIYENDDGESRYDCDNTAYLYALHVDKGYAEETKEAAKENPKSAYFYARDIIGKPEEDTLYAVMDSPEYLNKYITFFGEDFIKTLDPENAYMYAAKHQHNKVLEDIVCNSSRWAMLYAKNILNEPNEKTRNAACKNSESAYGYAHLVDKKPTKETLEAVKNTMWEEYYRYWFAKAQCKEKPCYEEEFQCKEPQYKEECRCEKEAEIQRLASEIAQINEKIEILLNT
jgi:hypothetical protein